MESAPGKVPPHNLEAEKGLLGSMLLASGQVPEIFQLVGPDSFYLKQHQLIFEAIQKVFDQHGTVDAILLNEHLSRAGVLTEAGGLPYLLDLTESVRTSVNAVKYARIVRDRSLLRRLISTCTELAQEAYSGSVRDASECVERAEQRVFEIAQQRGVQDVVPMRDAVTQTFDLLDRLSKGATGLRTGFDDLDDKTGGLQPSELVVVAGRPSMGKTTFAMNIARNIALGRVPGQEKQPVLIFSLEVDRRQIVINMLSSIAQVKSQAIRKGGRDLGERDWHDLTTAAGRLSEAPLFIDDSSGLNTMAIRAKARRMKARHDIQLIIVDYLQMLEFGSGRQESRQHEISNISRALKTLARELKIPVLTISQLSRAVEAREQHRPRLSDLRESGAIEQDADLVLLLYREEYYHPEKPGVQGAAEAIIAKQRNGPIGSIPLTFIGDTLRFENSAQTRAEYSAEF